MDVLAVVLRGQDVDTTKIALSIVKESIGNAYGDGNAMQRKLKDAEDDVKKARAARSDEIAKVRSEKAAVSAKLADAEAALSRLRAERKGEADRLAKEQKDSQDRTRDVEVQLERLRAERDEELQKLRKERKELTQKAREQEVTVTRLRGDLKGLKASRDKLVQQGSVADVSLEAKLQEYQEYIRKLEVNLQQEMTRHAPLYGANLDKLSLAELETLQHIHEEGLRQVAQHQAARGHQEAMDDSASASAAAAAAAVAAAVVTDVSPSPAGSFSGALGSGGMPPYSGGPGVSVAPALAVPPLYSGGSGGLLGGLPNGTFSLGGLSEGSSSLGSGAAGGGPYPWTW